MRCPWLLAQTKLATIFGNFFHLFLLPLLKPQKGVSYGKKWFTFVAGILVMTLEGLGEMFRGYSAETCARKIPLVPMGV